MENKNIQKAGKYHYTSQISKGSEAGGVKTFPNFPEMLLLWKMYFALLPSCPSGEQLKSKAMCTKSISKPRNM